MSEPDPMMTRVGEARALHRRAVAHSMAAVQDDVREELVLALQALEAADLITDERATQAGVASPVAGFYPSLHLNGGECYRKLGDLDQAPEHLELGKEIGRRSRGRRLCPDGQSCPRPAG